jgi:hypothetical protein
MVFFFLSDLWQRMGGTTDVEGAKCPTGHKDRPSVYKKLATGELA